MEFRSRQAFPELAGALRDAGKALTSVHSTFKPRVVGSVTRERVSKQSLTAIIFF